MKIERVDQLVAGYAKGDAISQEARLFRDTFRKLGYKSDIIVPSEYIAFGYADDCRPLESFKTGKEHNVLIYHYSTASRATNLFIKSPCKRIMRYHNITPSSYFKGFDDEAVLQLERGRRELLSVAEAADSVWAVSAFNAMELKNRDIRNIKIVPLLFGVDEFDISPDKETLDRFAGSLKNIVSLGRVVPNKCIEELIFGFAYYNRFINPYSRLILVGSERSCPRYYAMLRMLTERLDLQNVCLEGFLLNPQRSAIYQSADLFVSTSRHEGYCLPLIEAMYHETPVMARECGGMPEAMGGAGVLFDNAEPKTLAELMNRVLLSGSIRETILDSQAVRLKEIQNRNIEKECRELVLGS